MNAISFSSSRKQKRLGPAPFASMEDTTAEEKGQMEHQNNHQAYRSTNDKFPNDFHRTSPTKSLEYASALAPATPRIDISRASSHSSHHDSRDSSPENVFEQVGTGTLQDSGGLGFREEDTLDLRNSTEELQFMESEKGTDEKEKPKTQLMYGSSSVQRGSPIIWKLDDAPTTLLSQLQQHQQLLNRKDSASSEVVAFLSISGRTSRLSSVGSQGSANSKLSATSALSGISRSPSPHKMLLETSFCGTKPSQNFADGSIASSSLEPGTENVLEQVILSRKKDPTVAVLAEGVQIQLPIEDSIPQQAAPIVVANISGFEQHSNGGDRHVRRKSDCGTATVCLDMMPHFKMGQTSRSVGNKRNIPPRDLKNSIIGVMPSGTEYIRIKLKPDHCYSDNGIADNERVIENAKENGGSELVITHHEVPNITRSPSPANVSVSRKNSFCSLFKFKETTPTDKLNNVQQSQQSRKKRTSTTSNESSAIGIDASANLTPSKQKLVLKMFRPKRDSKSKSPSPMGSASDQLYDGEDRVDVGGDYSLISNKNTTQVSSATTGYRSWGGKALDGQSIHIPLHTPPEERRPRETLPSSAVNTISTSSAALDGISVSTSITSILKNPKPKTVPKQPRIANMTVTIHDRPKPMPPLKCYRIDNPDGSILIPLKSPIEDKTIDSHHWESVIGELSQRIEKQTCEDREETVDVVIPSNKNCKNTDLINTGYLLQEYDIESLNSNQNRTTNSMVASPPTSPTPKPPPPPPPPPLPTPSQPLSSKPAPVIPTSFKQEACEVSSKLRKLANPGIEKLGTLPQQAATAAKMMQQKQQQQAFFHLRMSSGSDDKIFSTTLNDYSTELEQHSSTVGLLHRSADYHNSISSELPGKAFAGNCSDTPSEALTSVSVTSSSPQQVSKQERGEEIRIEQHSKLCQGHTHHNTLNNCSEVATAIPPKIYNTAAVVAHRNTCIGPSESTGNDFIHQNANQSLQQLQSQHLQLTEEKNQEHYSISTNMNLADRVTGEEAGIMSSGSEKDSEIDSVSTAGHHALHPNVLAIEDHESAGLVFQESFDDELPYIPTTLPEERPIGIKLIPAKERTQIDVRTYHPLERPRSTTPIHLASLEAYCDRTPVVAAINSAMPAGERSIISTMNVTEKLHISLPSKKHVDTYSGKKIFEHRSSLGSITMPPYTASSATKTASTGGAGGRQYRSASTTIKSSVVAEDSQTFTTPPPLPPRKTSATTTTPPGQKWIDVEAIPEMRKAPKRITAIPQKQLLQNFPTSSSHSRPLESVQDGQVYTYVNPEDCKCECHDHERIVVATSSFDQELRISSELAESKVDDVCKPSLQPSSSQ